MSDDKKRSTRSAVTEMINMMLQQACFLSLMSETKSCRKKKAQHSDFEAYIPGRSAGDKATSHRKAVAVHYARFRNRATINEKRRIQVAEKRAAVKLKRRGWGPVKSNSKLTAMSMDPRDVLPVAKSPTDSNFSFNFPQYSPNDTRAFTFEGNSEPIISSDQKSPSEATPGPANSLTSDEHLASHALAELAAGIALPPEPVSLADPLGHGPRISQPIRALRSQGADNIPGSPTDLAIEGADIDSVHDTLLNEAKPLSSSRGNNMDVYIPDALLDHAVKRAVAQADLTMIPPRVTLLATQLKCQDGEPMTWPQQAQIYLAGLEACRVMTPTPEQQKHWFGAKFDHDVGGIYGNSYQRRILNMWRMDVWHSVRANDEDAKHVLQAKNCVEYKYSCLQAGKNISPLPRYLQMTSRTNSPTSSELSTLSNENVPPDPAHIQMLEAKLAAAVTALETLKAEQHLTRSTREKEKKLSSCERAVNEAKAAFTAEGLPIPEQASVGSSSTAPAVVATVPGPVRVKITRNAPNKKSKRSAAATLPTTPDAPSPKKNLSRAPSAAPPTITTQTAVQEPAPKRNSSRAPSVAPPTLVPEPAPVAVELPDAAAPPTLVPEPAPVAVELPDAAAPPTLVPEPAPVAVELPDAAANNLAHAPSAAPLTAGPEPFNVMMMPGRTFPEMGVYTSSEASYFPSRIKEPPTMYTQRSGLQILGSGNRNLIGMSTLHSPNPFGGHAIPSGYNPTRDYRQSPVGSSMVVPGKRETSAGMTPEDYEERRVAMHARKVTQREAEMDVRRETANRSRVALTEALQASTGSHLTSDPIDQAHLGTEDDDMYEDGGEQHHQALSLTEIDQGGVEGPGIASGDYKMDEDDSDDAGSGSEDANDVRPGSMGGEPPQNVPKTSSTTSLKLEEYKKKVVGPDVKASVKLERSQLFTIPENQSMGQPPRRKSSLVEKGKSKKIEGIEQGVEEEEDEVEGDDNESRELEGRRKRKRVEAPLRAPREGKTGDTIKQWSEMSDDERAEYEQAASKGILKCWEREAKSGDPGAFVNEEHVLACGFHRIHSGKGTRYPDGDPDAQYTITGQPAPFGRFKKKSDNTDDRYSNPAKIRIFHCGCDAREVAVDFYIWKCNQEITRWVGGDAKRTAQGTLVRNKSEAKEVTQGMLQDRLDPRTRAFLVEALKSNGLTFDILYREGMSSAEHNMLILESQSKKLIARMTAQARKMKLLAQDQGFVIVHMPIKEIAKMDAERASE
ncbi:hypothetical protein C8R43DRAFT_964525 [Mycena crocata]|nr:hypothetical protein C8R43DRAFT_964525 [Mycena crocata]